MIKKVAEMILKRKDLIIIFVTVFTIKVFILRTCFKVPFKQFIISHYINWCLILIDTFKMSIYI